MLGPLTSMRRAGADDRSSPIATTGSISVRLLGAAGPELAELDGEDQPARRSQRNVNVAFCGTHILAVRWSRRHAASLIVVEVHIRCVWICLALLGCEHIVPPPPEARSEVVRAGADPRGPGKDRPTDVRQDDSLTCHRSQKDDRAPDPCRRFVAITNDRYRALTRGSGIERASAALEIVKGRASESRAVVRRALGVIASQPYCAHVRPVVDTIDDCDVDEATRAAAAMTLGIIAKDFPCVYPGACSPSSDPIPSWATLKLETCVSRSPVAVQRACIEALGYVRTANRLLLRQIRDSRSSDSISRLAAGRALSRLTGTRSVTRESLDALRNDSVEVAR